MSHFRNTAWREIFAGVYFCVRVKFHLKIFGKIIIKPLQFRKLMLFGSNERQTRSLRNSVYHMLGKLLKATPLRLLDRSPWACPRTLRAS